MSRHTVVILGQGYVGLPLARAATAAGHAVRGFDVNGAVVALLNSGGSHVDDISDRDLQGMLRQGYRATTDAAVITEADVVIICVPTPLAADGSPDLGAVTGAAERIAEHLRPGMLVVLESTTYPGTTEELVLPILERSGLRHGSDFLLAFSPERVDPGNPLYGIKNTPKLVGGVNQEAAERAVSFYRSFVDTVVALSGTREAETAKLLENTYRHVNIALVNELARLCHELGIDVWEVIRGAATKPFGFQAFRPGPGVGGHCIPIDPHYLGYQVRKTLGYQFRFVELAQEINNSMPAYVVQRVMELLNERRLPLAGSHILLLGVTYKPDVADLRESPAIPIAKLLLSKGAEISYADPHVPVWTVGDETYYSADDLNTALSTADLVVLLQNHAAFDVEHISDRATMLFDTSGTSNPERAKRL